MLKYAKITNEETKECSVGTGTNTDFYKSIGMSEMDVEQAYDGTWYVVGYVPEKSQEEKEKDIRSIREQYFAQYIDWYQSKPLLWSELSEEEKSNISEYRQYLKDYTLTENWFENNPLSFDEWKKTIENIFL